MDELELNVDDGERAVEHASDPIVAWRFKVFRRLGYTHKRARELAVNRAVDYHQVEALLQRGATLEQAREIVS